MRDVNGARVLPFRPREETAAPRRGAVRAPSESAPAGARNEDATRRPRATEAALLRHGTGDATPLRRHRGARIRHSRRSPSLRLAKVLLLTGAVIGGPTGLAVWVFRSPVFALSELNVATEEQGRVSEVWVHEALRPAQGWNLPRLPLRWVDDALKRHPWVKGASIRKELPGRLSIRVIEKREVAIRRGGGDPQDAVQVAGIPGAGVPDVPDLWYLDENAEVIAPFDPADGEIDLPLVSAGSYGLDLLPALALVDEITAAAPEWAAGLSEIEVLGARDFRVWNVDLPFPLLLRSGTLEHKTAYLERLLPEISRRYGIVDAVDLRFARRIILQPSARGPGRSLPGVHQKGLGG